MSLGPREFLALLPLLVLAGAAVVTMLIAAFSRRSSVSLALTLLGLAAAGATVPLAGTASGPITHLLAMNGYAAFSFALIIAAAFAIALLAYRYFGGDAGPQPPFHILLLLATLGAAVLASSTHFATLFLGLELMSISLFAMIAYARGAEPGIEAGIKYLVLAGVASAFLLFGMALIYLRLGSLEFARLAELLATAGLSDPYVIAGFTLIVVGLGFKLALVPFHMWTPDIYEGASSPVAGFIATVSKGAALIVLFRFYDILGGHRSAPLGNVLTLLAAASILIGNLLALLQDNLKRMLAYSSISHLGYLMIAFIAAGRFSGEAIAYYLVAYFASMIAAFGVIGAISGGGAARDRDMLADYQGLFWAHPWLAGVFTAMLLSLAGIPLTMGFIGKFYIFVAGVDASLWLLVFVLVVGSVIGLFYYLRVIAAMYAHPEVLPGARAPGDLALEVRAAPADRLVLACLTGLVVVLGIFPQPLVHLLHLASALLQ